MNDQLKQAIITKFRAGITLNQICRDLRISLVAVCKVLHQEKLLA